MQLQPNWHDSKPAPPEWVVWDYTPTEWAAFDQAEWERADQVWQRWVTLACIVAACVLGAVFFLLLLGASAGAFPLVLFGGGATIALFTNNSTAHQRALTSHKARQRGPAQVRLGPGGVTIGRDYIPFSRPVNIILNQDSMDLHWVHFVAGPPARLVFALTYGHGRDEVVAPVPAGAQDAATALVARYKREVIRRRPAAPLQPNALPSRPARPAVPAPSLPTDHPTQHLPAFDPNPPQPSHPTQHLPDFDPNSLQASHPTQRLPRPWVGGTPSAQRYGRDTALPLDAAPPPAPNAGSSESRRDG